MSLLNDASLVMIPSGYKDTKLYSVKPTNGDGDFTFSRGSNLAATRVNSEGLIEKGRENLFFASDTSDSAAGRATRGSSTTIKGVSGYFYSDSGAGNPNINKSVAGYSTGFATFSIYVDTTNANSIKLNFAKDGNASNGTQATFNATTKTWGSIIENGTYVSSGSTQLSFEDLGDNVFRLSIGANFTASGSTHFPVVYFGTGNTNVAIGGAQVERSLVATDYIETTTTTAQAGILEDMPRLDYSGGATCGSLLLEPQRTNGNTHSEYFEAWNLVNSGISVLTPNEYISPEGLQNAYKLEFTGSGGSSQIYQVLSGVGIGTVCTASVFVKYISGSGDNFRITKSFATAGVVCDFTNNGENLSVSEVGSSTSDDVGFEDMGNGWFRIYFTFTSDTTNWEININRASGSGSDVYAIYGYQLETSASYASSYIPTYGSSSTRSEDIVDGAVDANLFNDDEGVLFVEFAALADTRDNEFRFLISDGTNNERIQIGLQTSNTLYCSVISSNSATADFTTSLGSPSSTHKVAIRYKSNDFAAYLDGTQIGTDTSGGTPSGLDRFDFYRTPNNNNYVEANVKQTIYFNSALTNDELADLTTL